MPLRAKLDSGSQVSFITADKAKALMLPRKSSQFTIQTLGSDSAECQRTCGLLQASLFDTNIVTLHIILHLTNTIPSLGIYTSRLKHVHNLDLADPHFNTLGKFDLLLVADILEDLLLDNGVKGYGSFRRESILRCVLSRPIVE